MPQLDPTWFASQLFWLFVTFALLYFVLSKLVLPPLMDVMALRKDTVDSDLDTAQTLKSQADDAKAQYEKALAEARMRSQAIMDEAMQKYKAQAENALLHMEAQIATKLSEAEKRILGQKNELMQSLTPVAEELSKIIVSNITKSKDSSAQDSVPPLAKGNG